MRHHRAALLRQARHVEHGGAPALEVGGHGEDLANGDDAGAAYAGDDRAEGPAYCRQDGVGQGEVDVADRAGLAFFQRATFDRDKARAKALHAGVVLVAGGLVDLALAAEFGFQRLHRQAVGFVAAVAATLAHRFVDDGALGRVGEGATFSAAAFFRGAGLVVNQRRGAGHVAQLFLHCIEFVAVAQGDTRRPIGSRRVFFRLVSDDDDGVDALCGDLPRNHRRIEGAVDGLAAGHGDGVVVEDFVGDVDLGGHRRANGEQAGMEISAVADVCEDVLFAGERRLPYPSGAFAAHMAEGGGAAVHPKRHEVAADAGQRAAAFGHACRGVVGAARAEVGLAFGHDARLCQCFFFLLQIGEALAVAFAERFIEAKFGETLGDRLGDHGRG